MEEPSTSSGCGRKRGGSLRGRSVRARGGGRGRGCGRRAPRGLDFGITLAEYLKKKRLIDKNNKSVEKRNQLKELRDRKEVAQFMMPDAPPKKTRKVSPVRITCPLLPGTPEVPPLRVLQPWELNRRKAALHVTREPSKTENKTPPPKKRKQVFTASTEVVTVDKGTDVDNIIVDANIELIGFSTTPSTSGVRVNLAQLPVQCPSSSTNPEPSIYEDTEIVEWESSVDVNPGSDIDEDVIEDLGNTRRIDTAHFDSELSAEHVDTLNHMDQRDNEALRDLASQDMLYFDWSNDPDVFTGQRENFTGEAGPTFSPDGMSPLEIFKKIWDDEIINLIVLETNRYGADLLLDPQIKEFSRLKKWTPVTPDEIWKFFAIIMLQSIVAIAVEKDYWNPSLPYLKIGNFADIMSFNRFKLIKKCLHFADNHASRGIPSKLTKIKPIIDHLNNKFSSLYLPEQNIALDESLLLWKGRLAFSQLIANKVARVGIKSYELCESRTGYLWKMIIYTGKTGDDLTEVADEQVSEGATSKIVHNLVRPLLNKGHTLVMDNFYNSPLLCRTLKSKKTDTVGTLRLTREFVPDSLRSKSKINMRPGEVAFSQTKDLTILVWRDTNVVSLISTYHKVEIGGKEKHGCYKYKPKVVLDYNLTMGGIDKKDQMLQAFPVERIRNLVWYKKLFRRLLNVSIHNSCIIFNAQHNINMVQRQFRTKLADEILQKIRPPTIQAAPAVGHFPAKNGKKKGRCKWCALKKKDTSTVWKCETCNINLCIIGCYKEYHTS